MFIIIIIIVIVIVIVIVITIIIIIIRPHRSTAYVEAVYGYRPSSVVCRSICPGHTSELCKNGLTNRYAVWVEDSGGPGEPCIRWDPDSPWERAILRGKGAPIV